MIAGRSQRARGRRPVIASKSAFKNTSFVQILHVRQKRNACVVIGDVVDRGRRRTWLRRPRKTVYGNDISRTTPAASLCHESERIDDLLRRSLTSNDTPAAVRQVV